ncbi:MAG: TIGR04283 family arsenosugar biosynthesis glycosyltransferase [Nitrospirae bacterium]|nr:TIGR04283 family arsenosugar biosynthesis glycosyltransferase [Nitrospirota bacterium]
MISIIIPTLNEELLIARCIDALGTEGFPGEIIVADGGSADRTREIALSRNRVMVIDSPKGRGTQMNAGSAVAAGDILLFLHADTILEQGWAEELCSALDDRSVVGGAFRFCIDDPSSKFRLVEAWVNMRCRAFGLPYGDQAIFIRKSIFEKLGGYKAILLMEDVDIIKRMKKLGRIAVLQKKAVTSGRRWISRGLLRTAATNQMTMLLYQLGVSPDKLARFYYR